MINGKSKLSKVFHTFLLLPHLFTCEEGTTGPSGIKAYINPLAIACSLSNVLAPLGYGKRKQLKYV